MATFMLLPFSRMCSWWISSKIITFSLQSEICLVSFSIDKHLKKCCDSLTPFFFFLFLLSSPMMALPVCMFSPLSNFSEIFQLWNLWPQDLCIDSNTLYKSLLYFYSLLLGQKEAYLSHTFGYDLYYHLNSLENPTTVCYQPSVHPSEWW